MCVGCKERIILYSEPERKIQQVVVSYLRTKIYYEPASRTR
jgi:hypothetical protein